MSDSKGKDSIMKMLLSSSTLSTLSPPSPAQVNNSATSGHSPMSDFEDNSSKLTVYLSQISSGGQKVNISPWDKVYEDHNYSKTGDTKLDQWKLRPTRTLFMVKHDSHNPSDGKETLDVLTEQSNLIPPYDLTKAQHLMNECERCVSFARMEQGSDDWEETITKIGWTTSQNSLFNKTVKILDEDRLSRLADTNRKNEPVHRRLTVDKSAWRFRNMMAGVMWDTRLAQWLHSVLIENLSTPYLSAYLDILQTLKCKIPNMIEKMMNTSNQTNKLSPVVTEGLNLLLKRPWDPTASVVNHHKLRKLPSNPIIVVVPSGPRRNQTSNRIHLWNTQLSHLGTVVHVPFPSVAQIGKVTMISCLEQMMTAAKNKIAEVKVDCPGRPIILLGWRSGAALACQMAVVESVSCVVCLGMASRTCEGKRGEVEDTLLDIISPVLFVVGENAAASRRDDFEAMREKMQVQSGLLVAGGCDDYLRMSRRVKRREGVTQSLVDTCILEEIGDFLTGVLSIPQPNNSRLQTVYSNISAILSSMNDTRKSIYSSVDRKRNNSNVSSVDGEPTGKRPRPGSPANQNKQKNSYNKLSPPTRGRRPGSSKKNLAASQGVTTSAQQQPTALTMNIGSYGSLGQMGPLRLNPSGQSVTQSAYKINQSPSRTAFTKHTLDGAQTFVIQAGNKSVSAPVKLTPGGETSTGDNCDNGGVGTASPSSANVTTVASGGKQTSAKLLTPSTPISNRVSNVVGVRSTPTTVVVSPSALTGGIKTSKQTTIKKQTPVTTSLPRTVMVSRSGPTVVLQRPATVTSGNKPRTTVLTQQQQQCVNRTTVRALSAGQKITFAGKMLSGSGNVILVPDGNTTKTLTNSSPVVKFSTATKTGVGGPSRIVRQSVPILGKSGGATLAKLTQSVSKTNKPIIVQRSNILRSRQQQTAKVVREEMEKPVVIPIVDVQRGSRVVGSKVSHDVSYDDDGDTLSFPLDCDMGDVTTTSSQQDEDVNVEDLDEEEVKPSRHVTSTGAGANTTTQLILTKKDVKKKIGTQMVLESASGEKYLIEEDDDDDEEDDEDDTQVLVTTDDDDNAEYILDCSSLENEEGEVIYEIVQTDDK